MHAANIIKPTQTRINCEKYTFALQNQGSPKNIKTGRVPYLGLEMTIHDTRPQKLNPSPETVPIKIFTEFI